MQDLIFKDSEFGEFDLFVAEDKIYFPATQCAKVLGYKNPQEAIRIKCKGVRKILTPTTGGSQEVNYIPEGDLYRLIVHSKLPNAERFERWVFDDVLPTIHKTGGYVNNDELFINTYLPYADENTKNLCQKSLLQLLQCHCFPIFLLAKPKIPIEVTLLKVPIFETYVE